RGDGHVEDPRRVRGGAYGEPRGPARGTGGRGRRRRARVNGTAAVLLGTGRPFELRQYPLLDPEPGGILARVITANVCGSDLHMWRGELNLERLRLPFPLALGHEAVGQVERLRPGVTTDSAGLPLAPGDRISWRYFSPCGRCPA